MVTAILMGILGAVIQALLGTFWYSMATPMGQWHMQHLGFNKLTKAQQQKQMEKSRGKMWKYYGAQLLLSFLTGYFIGFVTYYTVENGGPVNAVYFYVAFIWLCFTVPSIGGAKIWEIGMADAAKTKLAWKRFFSDSLYQLISFLIIAFIATLLMG